jgi:PAS domain S-box-containing protein
MELSEKDDKLNIITTGLNMLGDELQNYKKELDAKNLFLESILNTIDQIVYVINTDPNCPEQYMRHTFVSAPVQKILGYLPEDIIARSHKLCQSVYEEDRLMVLETFQSVIKTGQAGPCIYRVVHKTTGKLVWVEDLMVPQRNSHGQVIQVIGSAKDITERKKAEELLMEQKQFTEKILNLLPVDIAVLDKDHKYTFLNPAAVRDPETREWLIGRDDFDYCAEKQIPTDVAENRRKLFLEAEKNGSDAGWLDTYTDRNGGLRYKLRRFLPVIEKGVFKYAIGYAVDITELKKASLEKEKLIRELNNKFNELMQFNYIVSHNLRGPVASILGLTSLLEAGLPEDEKNKAVTFLHKASTAIDTTIKDLSLILASRSPLNEKIEQFLISNLIEEVKTNLSRQITDADATIYLKVTDETNQISSIKSYVQSVMYNLISNAIKYKSPERPPVITIQVTKEQEHTSITVADNGIGIDLEQHGNQLFGLYKRFHLKTEGKGLGLYMSKMQLESLGGSISVESTPGKGTIFKIRF